MENSIFMIQGQIEPETVFKAECSYCYNSAEIDTEDRKEAAIQLHSLGWRFANNIEHEKILIIGLVCPSCSKKIDFKDRRSDGKK